MTEQHHGHCSKHIIYSVAKRMDKFNSNETRTKQNDVFSLELTKHSFIPTSPNTTLRRHDNHHSPEEELNLGLSLGGQFGVDKSHKGLIRSSSVGGAITLTSGEEALIRTASLPPELQSFGRIEAKRKRLEKQTSVKENGSGDNLNLNLDLEFPGKCNWVHVACGNLQGSSESQGKRSSSGVNFESEKTLEGFGSNGEERTSGSIQSLEEAGSCPGIRTAQVSSKRFNTSDIQKKARVNEKIEDMPCVFTIGDGPKGRKVEGILYRYRKGEEVRIMCVCHGSFFSPAEFVNHAGARDVAHPLKRIVVNPNG